jgi:hypothetical protein
MWKSLTLVFAISTLSACSSSASLVRKDALGGRVQLAGAYVPAMGDARMLMVEHCHGRYDAMEVGEAVEFRCRSGAAGSAGAGAKRVLAWSDPHGVNRKF